MRYRLATTFLPFLVALFALWTEAARAAEIDADAWRRLPVQDGGRYKPLDTLAAESLRMIGGGTAIEDPQSGEQLEPTALCLRMLFDWTGFDHEQREQLLLVSDWRSHYFHLHQADKWDQAPLLRVDYVKLREALGLPEDSRHVSPEQLHTAKVEDPRNGQLVLFRSWIVDLRKQKAAGEELWMLEQKALELAGRYEAYQNLRMGRTLKLLPVRDAEDGSWMSAAHLLLTRFDETSDPSGRLRSAQQLIRQTRAAYRSGDHQRFDRTSSQLLAALGKLGPELGDYPSARAIGLEVAYNRWVPFRFAWCLMLTAAAGMLVHAGCRRSVCAWGAWAAFIGAVTAMATGLTMRGIIAGRLPVATMYETVIFAAAGVAVLGLVFELVHRGRVILTAAASVSALALLAADCFPTVLDPGLRPLASILQSDFWLVLHVITITLGFAALGLALAIGNVTLGYYWARSSNRDAVAAQSRLTLHAVQAGVLLLTAGAILGAAWADNAWGSFWSWDPKQVWTLIALMGYLAALHGYRAGWLGNRGLALSAVGCFSLVVMAWYGVNFVLAAGLHRYGFGSGGVVFVAVAVTVQLLYAVAAAARSPQLDVPANEVTQPRTAHVTPHASAAAR